MLHLPEMGLAIEFLSLKDISKVMEFHHGVSVLWVLGRCIRKLHKATEKRRILRHRDEYRAIEDAHCTASDGVTVAKCVSEYFSLPVSQL